MVYIAITCILAITLMAYKFWRGLILVRSAESEVLRKEKELESLTLSEAGQLAHDLMPVLTVKDGGGLQSPGGIPVVTQKEFMGRWAPCYFPSSETTLETGYQFLKPPHEEYFVIASNKTWGYIIAGKAGCDEVFDFGDDGIRDSYPSLFHYIIMTESDFE